MTKTLAKVSHYALSMILSPISKATYKLLYPLAISSTMEIFLKNEIFVDVFPIENYEMLLYERDCSLVRQSFSQMVKCSFTT